MAYSKEKKREYNREYNKKNRERITATAKIWSANNKDKVRKSQKEADRKYRLKHKDRVDANRKRWNKNNPEKVRAHRRARGEREIDKTKACARSKKWREENREYVRERDRKKFQTNPLHKLRQNIRARLHHALRNDSKSKKSKHTLELLGCSIKEYRIYLESKFKPGMTWENHGKYGWHIDHIIPCASFDLAKPEEQEKCFHYLNTQPLFAKENLSKGDKIQPENILIGTYGKRFKRCSKFIKNETQKTIPPPPRDLQEAQINQNQFTSIYAASH